MTLADPHKTILHPRVRQALRLTGIAAAGVFILLLIFPYVIISANQDELGAPLLLMCYFLAAAIAGIFVLLVVFWALPFRVGKLIAIAIAAYAFSSLALDATLPLSISVLEFGDEAAEAAPRWGSVIQVVGVAGLIALLWNLPITFLSTMGWAFAAVVAVTSVGPLALNAMSPPDAVEAEEVHDSSFEAPSYNIYHVLFDAYYGPWFEWATAELGIDQDQFAGFTHYRSVRSNHWSTSSSYPSFFSGTMYDGAQTIVDWRESQRASSLVTDLKKLGFHTALHAPYDRKGYGPLFLPADKRHFERWQGEYLAGRFSELWMVLDLWALRTAPIGVRHLIFQDGSGPFSNYATTVPLNRSKGYSSFRSFLRFLETETDRASEGNYFHVYVTLPHPPATLNREGRYVGRETTYEEEVLLATNMMVMLIDRLKELGRFENSFIIFQSDHGAAGAAGHRGQHLLDTVSMNDDTSERIGKDSISGYSGRAMDARLSPLLLVKPPAGCPTDDTLRTNVSLTQLLDLREFVTSVVLRTASDCTYPERHDVEVNVDRVLVGSKDFNPGPRVPSGEFERFRIHSDGTWEELPNVNFTYE